LLLELLPQPFIQVTWLQGNWSQIRRKKYHSCGKEFSFEVLA
jgi:hypothetical protein